MENLKNTIAKHGKTSTQYEVIKNTKKEIN